MSIVISLLGFVIAASLTIFNAREDRVIRPVFLFSGVHTLYVFPKVLALSVSNNPAANYFRMHGVDVTVAYMSLWCYLAFVLAYELFASRRLAVDKRFSIEIPDKAMMQFAVAVGGLGIVAFVGLVVANGGLRHYYFELGFYQANLSGLTVWLIFLSRFTYPAIAAMALVAAFRPSRVSLSLLALLSAFPLMNILLLFRRSDLLILGFIGLYALTLTRRIRVNRALVLVGIGVMAISISLLPYIRQDNISAITGQSYESEGTSTQERLTDSWEVDEKDEIVRAASAINDAFNSDKYGFGSFIWNSLVDQFVPATIVGVDVKTSWYIGNYSAAEEVQGYFDSEAFFYVAPMGFAQAYEQFGPFGWIIFAGLGVFVAVIERKSSKLSNRVFLMVALPIVCLAATNDITSVPARLVTLWILTRLLGKARLLVYPAVGSRDAIQLREKINPEMGKGLRR